MVYGGSIETQEGKKETEELITVSKWEAWLESQYIHNTQANSEYITYMHKM